MRQIARKLNKVELRFFVRVHKFDAGGLTPGKENLCAMTENMQADDVQRRKPRVVRCCLYLSCLDIISEKKYNISDTNNRYLRPVILLRGGHCKEAIDA